MRRLSSLLFLLLGALSPVAAGNRVQLRQQVETYPNGRLAARTVDLSYDADDRLITEAMISGTSTTAVNYTYDAGHNRTAKVVTQTVGSNTTLLANITYTISWPNLVTAVVTHLPGNVTTTAGYTYDPDGNAVQRRYSDSRNSGAWYNINYTYDYENRLVASEASMTGGNVNVSSADNEYFLYDYRSRRVLQDEYHYLVRNDTPAVTVASDTKTASVFSGGTAIREYAESQTVNAAPGTTGWRFQPSAATWTTANTTLAPSVEFVRGSDWGGGVGGILYAVHPQAAGSGDSGVNYYHYDGRGDVVAQTTGVNGALSYQAAYTAFGEHNPNAPSSMYLPGNAPNSVGVQGFGAEEWTAAGAVTDHFRKNTKEESDSGLVNEGRRYFNPELGTFMNRDPLGFADGPNVYSYVHQNPWTKFDPEGLAAADPSTDGTQTMADTVNQVTTDMKKQNWAPENSANPGAFGSEVHDRVSNALKGKDGWAVNVTFDTKTKKVLAVGEELAGSKVGTTQVDALYLAKGYSLKVGETLDASKVVNLFELKTSLLGKVGTDQAERLSGLIGRDFETVKSPIRWTASAGWSENPAFSIGAKAMAVLPLAFAAYAYVHQSNYDYQLDDFRSAVMQAKNADANERQVDQIIAIQKGSAYLSNFIPDTALDAATLGAIYKTIGDKK